MKLQDRPAFGALVIGGGIGYFLRRSGKPLTLSLLGGVAVGAADYMFPAWLKNRGINQWV